MFTAYDSLQDVIDISEITKITFGEIELEKKATFELMKDVEIYEMLDGIVFWTKDSRIDKVIELDYYGDPEIIFKETKLKQATKIKVMPESLKELWNDPETRMNLPLKTKAYFKRKKEQEEFKQEYQNLKKNGVI